MTELSINSKNTGITFALADYAKTVNGGKAVKLTKKQWAEVMAKVAELNSKRASDNKIFTGGTNFNGPANKNFIVKGDKINFTEEELQILLNEMGIDNIKGLSIERNNGTQELPPLLDTPPAIDVQETDLSALALKGNNIFGQTVTTPPAAAISINYTLTPAEGKKNTGTPAALNTHTDAPETPTAASEEVPAAQLPEGENPAPPVTTIDETLSPAKGKKTASQPDELIQQSLPETPLEASTEVKPPEKQTPVTEEIITQTNTQNVPVTDAEEETQTGQTNNDFRALLNNSGATGDTDQETEINPGAAIPRAFAKRNNLTLQNDTAYDNTREITFEISTKDFDIKDIKDSGKKVSEIGNIYAQLEVFNKKRELIARKIDGKYMIGNEFVSEEKFNKYAERKGRTVTQKIHLPKLNFDTRKALLDVMPKFSVSQTEIELEPIPVKTPELPFDVDGTPVSTRNQKIHSYVKAASEKYGVPEELILAVIQKESGFRNNLTSHKGAMGLMQLMPATARGLGIKNPWDPKQNIEGGARMLKTLIDHYDGDVMLALAGYNYGISNVNKRLKGKTVKDINAIYNSLPTETRNYVKTVYSNYMATRAQA